MVVLGGYVCLKLLLLFFVVISTATFDVFMVIVAVGGKDSAVVSAGPYVAEIIVL